MKKLLTLIGGAILCLSATQSLIACSINIEYIGNGKDNNNNNNGGEEEVKYISTEILKENLKIVEQLANEEAVENVVGGIKIEGVSGFEITKANETDVTVSAVLKENYKFVEGEEDSFILEHAIAAENEEPKTVDYDTKEACENLKNFVATSKFDSLEKLQTKLDDFEFYGIDKIQAAEVENTSDAIVKIQVVIGYKPLQEEYTLKGVIEQASEIEIKTNDISNNEQIKAIKDLEDLNAVQTQLDTVEIEGVKSLTATMVSDSTTDVNVEIAYETGYKVAAGDQPNFEITGAIKEKEPEKAIVKKADVIAQVEGLIKDLKDLDEVNEKLKEITIEHVISLIAEMDDASTTNVVVTIKIDEENAELDDADPTFIVTGAIKEVEEPSEPEGPEEGENNGE